MIYEMKYNVRLKRHNLNCCLLDFIFGYTWYIFQVLIEMYFELMYNPKAKAVMSRSITKMILVTVNMLNWCFAFNHYTVFENLKKVSFHNIASEASFIYIVSGQKFIKNAKLVNLTSLKNWILRSNSVTRQVKKLM